MSSWAFLGGLVVKNLLSMKDTWVQSLIWEEATCRGATKLLCHNY